VSLPLEAQLFPAGRKDTGPKPKNIHGAVQDARGKAMSARASTYGLKTNVVRTLTTDQEGLYKVYALPQRGTTRSMPSLKGKASEKKVVSSFLNREDNVINFQLDSTWLRREVARPMTTGRNQNVRPRRTPRLF